LVHAGGRLDQQWIVQLLPQSLQDVLIADWLTNMRSAARETFCSCMSKVEWRPADSIEIAQFRHISSTAGFAVSSKGKIPCTDQKAPLWPASFIHSAIKSHHSRGADGRLDFRHRRHGHVHVKS